MIKNITPIGIDSVVFTITNEYTVVYALSYVRLGGQINIFGVGLDSKPISIDLIGFIKRSLP